ncbi:DUF6 domain-containing protein [Histoplasma capsulatum G186AR]|uniref:DUF6 domain-containing protein n=1 Tax=Ajellomyces capsulatus TaxID=5037 RepID=A0A8H7YNP1_AJECA|nr:DUF6 domain-containing protein [Histoplasma capsulatum]QSS74728.1 DUF6 domain-containing protein [Histoplasma capsulatum G186AR]
MDRGYSFGPCSYYYSESRNVNFHGMHSGDGIYTLSEPRHRWSNPGTSTSPHETSINRQSDISSEPLRWLQLH